MSALALPHPDSQLVTPQLLIEAVKLPQPSQVHRRKMALNCRGRMCGGSVRDVFQSDETPLSPTLVRPAMQVVTDWEDGCQGAREGRGERRRRWHLRNGL